MSVDNGYPTNLIDTATFSNASTVEFTTQLTSDYKFYFFKFIDVHCDDDQVGLSFQCNRSGQSGFNESCMSYVMRFYHNEANNSHGGSAMPADDQQLGTAFQLICEGIAGSDADQSIAGDLFIFNPSGTGFSKHFRSRTSHVSHNDYASDYFTHGYFNFTDPLTEIRFKMTTGTMDGTIKLYGVK